MDCYEGKEPADVGLAAVAGARVLEGFDSSHTALLFVKTSGKFKLFSGNPSK
jgi:hypothetical protein